MANEQLRGLRLRQDLTQGQVAERVADHIEAATGRRPAIDANTVSRLERGLITWPNQEYRAALRAVFGAATDAELGLSSKRTRHDREEGVSASDRRDFLAVSLAGILPEVMPQPSKIGMRDVDDLADRTFALEEWDRRTGGQSTRHLAFAELNNAVRLSSGSMTSGVRDRLCGTIANLADLSAWSAFDSGLSGAARSTFGLGIQAARESGDPGILCHVATGLARQEIAAGRSREALDLADMSMGDVPVSALAMIAAVKAQAYALRGDETEVMRHISMAEIIYSRVRDLHGEPRWMWYFTEHKLQGDTGEALFLLSGVTGRPVAELVSRLRRSVDSLTSNRARTKAISSAHLATVLYRQGGHDEADHYARQAVTLAEGVRSARLDTAITDMRKAAP